MKKTTYLSETTTTVDKKTGEVASVETVKRQRIVVNSESFYMVFPKHMTLFFSLKSTISKSILFWLCAHAQYNTGRIDLSVKKRADMIRELKVNKSNVSIALRELREKNLLSGERGSYLINPRVFWKGDLKARNAVLNDKEFEVFFKIKPEDMEDVSELTPQQI